MRAGCSASAPQALAALRAAVEARDPIHIAILDFDTDGEQLGLSVRSDPQLRGTVLVMLSSLGHQSELERLRRSGVAACVLEPVRQSALLDALANAWSARTGAPHRALEPTHGQAGAVAEARGVRARVLVVEDNQVNQLVATVELERLGCRVDTASNGGDALAMLELLPYDLVLMDCEMPDMDGFTATARLRAMEGPGRLVPVVAVTAHALPGDRERCLEAGMDDYLPKPLPRQGLARVVERWCGPCTPRGVRAATPDR